MIEEQNVASIFTKKGLVGKIKTCCGLTMRFDGIKWDTITEPSRVNS